MENFFAYFYAKENSLVKQQAKVANNEQKLTSKEQKVTSSEQKITSKQSKQEISKKFLLAFLVHSFFGKMKKVLSGLFLLRIAAIVSCASRHIVLIRA